MTDPRARGARTRATEAIEFHEAFESDVADWVGGGTIDARREPAVPGPGEGAPGGHVLHVRAGAGSTVQTRPPARPPRFQVCDRIRLHLYPPAATSRTPLVFEVQLYCAGRRAWWWRRVALERPAWQVVELPLRYFRQGAGGVPRWEEVERIGLWFRHEAELLLDHVTLVRGRRADAAYLAPRELARIAFPEAPVETLRRRPFVIMGSRAGPELGPVGDLLAPLAKRAAVDLPTFGMPARPVPILVFGDVAARVRFWNSFVRLLGSRVDENQALDVSMGIGTVVLPNAAATDRRAVAAVGALALLEQLTGLAWQSAWVHGGLAARWTEHEDRMAKAVRAGVLDRRRQLPFSELLSGAPVLQRHAWQSAAVVDWLLTEPLRDRFHDALHRMRVQGRSDLRPLVVEHFGRSIEELELRWREHGMG